LKAKAAPNPSFRSALKATSKGIIDLRRVRRRIIYTNDLGTDIVEEDIPAEDAEEVALSGAQFDGNGGGPKRDEN